MRDTAGEARMNSSVMYSYEPPHMAKQKQDDQLEHTYSRCVRIWDVALKTCQKRWMIVRSGERGSVISVLVAWHDDDDDDIFIDFNYISIGSIIKHTRQLDPPPSQLVCSSIQVSIYKVGLKSCKVYVGISYLPLRTLLIYENQGL